jgi:hypothetical protein
VQDIQRHSVGGSGVEISRIGLGGYELGLEPDDNLSPEILGQIEGLIPLGPSEAAA